MRERTLPLRLTRTTIGTLSAAGFFGVLSSFGPLAADQIELGGPDAPTLDGDEIADIGGETGSRAIAPRTTEPEALASMAIGVRQLGQPNVDDQLSAGASLIAAITSTTTTTTTTIAGPTTTRAAPRPTASSTAAPATAAPHTTVAPQTTSAAPTTIAVTTGAPFTTAAPTTTVTTTTAAPTTTVATTTTVTTTSSTSSTTLPPLTGGS